MGWGKKLIYYRVQQGRAGYKWLKEVTSGYDRLQVVMAGYEVTAGYGRLW